MDGFYRVQHDPKNQQNNQVKKQRGKSEKTSPKGANFHKNTSNMTLAVN